MLVAGNIVSWGGASWNSLARIGEQDLSLYEEQFTDFIAQDAGEDLMDMYPEELRVAINNYLDKGPDFIKSGGASHSSSPTFIGFSPDAQKIIVDETHKRGKSAETHATSPKDCGSQSKPGSRARPIQHPEVLDHREMSDSLIREIKESPESSARCWSASMTGEAWKKHLADKEAAQHRIEQRDAQLGDSGLKRSVPRTLTSAERRRDARALGATSTCASRTPRSSSRRAAF